MIAWLDLETTGSNEHTAWACVLEVGIVFTDDNLVGLETFQSVVNPSIDITRRRFINEYDLPEVFPQEQYLDRLIELVDPVVREMHTANGLWDDVRKSHTAPHGLDITLARHLKDLKVKYGLKHHDKIALAGSGVGHFDSRWIKKHMPETAKHFTHWVYDVGVMRRFLRELVGIDTSFADPKNVSSGDGKTHRALDDARAHLAEAKIYRDQLREKWNAA